MMTYVTVNNKIFERLEDASEYEHCVCVAMDKTVALRVLQAKRRDLRERKLALEKELAAAELAEDRTYLECRKADAATEEAAKKAIPYGLFLYGQRPAPQTRDEKEA
jgi:hypothetical protein